MLAALAAGGVRAAPAPEFHDDPPATDGGGSILERYERARHALEQQRAEANNARKERDRLAGEAQSLQVRLVDNAARVQDLESEVATLTGQLDTLQKRAQSLSASFTADRAQVGQLLAVLQRLNADQPPALALVPADSLAAARGAMLVGAMLSPVYERAATLASQLRMLGETEAQLSAKRHDDEIARSQLGAARSALAVLLAEKNHEERAAETHLGEVETLTKTVVRQADDLKSLIDRIAALRDEDDSAAGKGMVVVAPDRKAATRLPRGSLRHPVVGTLTEGDPAGPGVTPGTHGTEGLWFEAQGAAQTVAPADGEVVFAGSYQKFGQVLILEIAGGYDLLLAGLGRIDVHIGDLVLAGEPVGVLPSGDKARLYLELRRNGQTVDPVPWMSAAKRKAKKS